MLIQICVPSLAIAGESNYNSNDMNVIYEIENDTNTIMIENGDVIPKCVYIVEHYKQIELENGLSTYKLADTDKGDYTIGQTFNANIKDYEGYELAEGQTTSVVISENSTDNILKIYYNKAQNEEPFSVWVPSAIYIDIDEYGKVIAKDNPAIYNAIKNRSIAVKEIKLRGENGWSFSENVLELKDKQNMPVGTKKLNVTLNGDPIKVNGENNTEASVFITPDNWVIAADSFLPLNIGAVAVAQLKDIISSHVFTIDFVIDYEKAIESVPNYIITIAESKDGSLADDSIDCILAIGGKLPVIPDAVPNDTEDMEFVGWFVQGTDTNINDIPSIGENITIEPKFTLTEDAIRRKHEEAVEVANARAVYDEGMAKVAAGDLENNSKTVKTFGGKTFMFKYWPKSGHWYITVSSKNGETVYNKQYRNYTDVDAYGNPSNPRIDFTNVLIDGKKNNVIQSSEN